MREETAEQPKPLRSGYTTGSCATATSLARLLLRAGAARVDIYCLARTPRPGYA